MSVQLIKDKEDEQQQTETNQPGSAFTDAKPSGTQQARAVQEAGPTRGTGFTGVGRYLQANVGSRLGEQVAGRVAQTGQQAQTRLGQSVGQFGQQLGQQRQRLTAQQQAAQSALQRIAGKAAETPAESTQAVDLTPSQEEVAAYQAVAGGQFQAPSGLQDIGDIRSQARLAGELAAGTRDTAGRLGLLRQVVGRGPQQYTKGQSALDALILGQSGGQLAAARRASAGLERKVGTEEMLAAERARQFGAESERAKAALTGEAAGVEKRTTSDIIARQSDYNTKVSELVDKIKEEVSTGMLSPEVADALAQYGITPNTRIYDRDLKELATFLAQSKGPAEELTATTKEEAARLQALKKLAGVGKEYSEEELKRVGTTLDPKTGLDISPEDFYTKFVKGGEERVQAAETQVKRLFPDLGGLEFSKGVVSPKQMDIINSVHSNVKRQQNDLRGRINNIAESIRQEEENAEESFLGGLFRELTGGRPPPPANTGAKRLLLMELQNQLSGLNAKNSALDNLLKEYGKGKSLLRKDELSK